MHEQRSVDAAGAKVESPSSDIRMSGPTAYTAPALSSAADEVARRSITSWLCAKVARA